ncbi:DUF4215 domain-containing protein [Nannocystis pusilla]|uniref:DUF4215 domain-containing protein n=1 Tax=Nannocystis pusilla TaxID=889268 RepID=A0ABS7TUU2_9BACT|nr:DUF4215 domain-containing protein [Nannocystis pusilla]MBZ5711926.1 DUF4215 domain-containing protein [Nannocystis pusilla]
MSSTSSLSGESSSSTGATAVCGDGIVEAPEECDDGNADPDDNCASCLRARWVFATSMLLSPELIGGLAGADSLCAQLALQAGLGDNWQSYRAWLSDSHESAGERIFAGLGRYRRRDGVVIAENFEQFLFQGHYGSSGVVDGSWTFHTPIRRSTRPVVLPTCGSTASRASETRPQARRLTDVVMSASAA